MGKDIQSRRDFLRHAVMLAGAGVTAPLWAAMKYDRNADGRTVKRQFHVGRDNPRSIGIMI